MRNFDAERIKERLLSPEELAASNFEDEEQEEIEDNQGMV